MLDFGAPIDKIKEIHKPELVDEVYKEWKEKGGKK
jgi:hypothetical protein